MKRQSNKTRAQAKQKQLQRILPRLLPEYLRLKKRHGAKVVHAR